jgi:hypothetical protein
VAVLRQARPDLARILGSLKDFQRETVDHVFRRLYLDRDRTHRFLVADEVGLGKTLIGRGIVGRTIDHLWDTVPRIDIIYICSSGDIARQNINRLDISEGKDWAIASRVTLLPSQLKGIQSRKVNFIAFTPATSFKLHTSAGRVDERVLLYWMLKEEWSLERAGPLNLLQGKVRDPRKFRELVRWFDSEDIDKSLMRAFHGAIVAHDAKSQSAGLEGLRARFEELSEDFARTRKHVPKEHRTKQTRLLGEMRSLLASTCIRALQPDLVILDEFQRFKDLLTVDEEEPTEEAALARELFDYSEEDQKTRILLLSATPYKMYTTADETATDDHYADFLLTLRFLHDDSRKTERVAEILQRYRQALYQIDSAPLELVGLRKELEKELRHVIERTERLACSEDRNGMLREIRAEGIHLTSGELLAYPKLQRLARLVEHPDTIEYWKSAPYLLSFMDDYLLKRKVKDSLEAGDNRNLNDAVAGARELFLPDRLLRGRAPVDAPQARMRWLLTSVLDEGLWRLLWMPPAMPYYAPEGAYADERFEKVTKRLVFSAWRVVPKAIAGLLSYEAERRMLAELGQERESLTKVRERQSELLRFSRTGDRLSGMPVLALIYPSFFLAELGDPLDAGLAQGALPGQAEILQVVEGRIASALENLPSGKGPIDESWYWAAPILLDLGLDSRATREWLHHEGLAELWAGGSDMTDSPDSQSTAWSEHVDRAREFADGKPNLGTRPKDLARILAQLALAGPAVASLRAFGRIAGREAMRDDVTRIASGSVGWGFRNLFNLPEVIGLLRGGGADEVYWRRVLDYCLNGNLQAVLDEYFHILKDSLGLVDKSASETVSEISETIRDALGLRASRFEVDRLGVASDDGRASLSKSAMRARFALRFGDESDLDEKVANRKDLVRSAFNSPFWPFVLATTSVGQEGLDFHWYCHSIVHWNLPSNPVDLEQREGRVHRFKGHAVRKNVARKHREAVVGRLDPWLTVFDAARADRGLLQNDIIPYWVYQIEGGATIERHVPTLPLSREELRLPELRRSLAIYRMVFGQPRQDEMLEYLMRQVPVEQLEQRVADLQIDLSAATQLGQMARVVG